MTQDVLVLFNQHLEDNYLEWYDTDQDGMDSRWYEQYLKFQQIRKMWDVDDYHDRAERMNNDMWDAANDALSHALWEMSDEYQNEKCYWVGTIDFWKSDEAWDVDLTDRDEHDYSLYWDDHDYDADEKDEELTMIHLDFNNISEINK